MFSFKPLTLLIAVWFLPVVKIQYPQILSQPKKYKKNHRPLFVWFAFKYQNSHRPLPSVHISATHPFPILYLPKKFWIKVKTYIRGDDEHCIIWCELLRDFLFLFSPPLCSFFCLFHFSSCLVPPLRCSFYWNSNGSRVCVASKSRNWTHLPLSACGTKPWPHSSTVVKRFCYVP